MQLLGFDVAVAVGVLDGALERSERKSLFDVALALAERPRDVRDAASLFQELGEGLAFLKLVHAGARHILDQGCFEGVGVVVPDGDRARQQDLADCHPLFFGDLVCREVTPPARDDLKRLAVRPDQQGLQDAARADRRQDIGDVGGFPAVADVDACDLEIAESDVAQFHDRFLSFAKMGSAGWG